MTLAKFEEPWGSALQVALDGGAWVVVFEGETLGVGPEKVHKGRELEVTPIGESLEEAHTDETLEVETEFGTLEVELEGGTLKVELEGGTLAVGPEREVLEVL